jgi:hypothetical protein
VSGTSPGCQPERLEGPYRDAGTWTAVNVVIFSGIEDGYEASPGDVFEQNMIAGVLVVASLVAAPVFGVVALRRLRRSRTKPKRPDQPVSSA